MPASVSKITPGRDRPGEIVVIEGDGFSTVPGRNVVTFDGVLAGINSNGETELQVVVPLGIGVDQHVPVVVENLDDPGAVTWYWWSVDTVPSTDAMVLRTKIPWTDERLRGLSRSIKNMSTAEARFFQRNAERIELVRDLLNAKGAFFSKAATGLRRAAPGTAGQPFVSAIDTTGGQFQDRVCQTLQWGRALGGLSLNGLMEAGGADDLTTEYQVGAVALHAGQLALLSLRERASASSRVNRVEILVNGVVVLDLQAGDPDFPGPGFRNGQHLTVYPGLRLAQGDQVALRISRNTTTTVCYVLAYGLVV